VDLDASTRSVERLLRAGRAGHPEALTRLDRQRGSVMRSDAERTIAAEAGYPSWARLVDALTFFEPLRDDAVALPVVERLILVPFRADDSVVLIDGRDFHALPAGRVDRGAAPADAAVRIARSKANLRLLGGDVVAGARRGSWIAMRVQVEPLDPDVAGRSSVVWWTGTPAAAADILASENAPALAHLVLLAEHSGPTDPSGDVE
jgi:hypothetical protein